MLLVGLDLPLKVLPLIRLLLVHVHVATNNQYDYCMIIVTPDEFYAHHSDEFLFIFV